MRHATTPTPTLRAEGITKRFGTAVVLDQVSLHLAAGRVDGLVGRNGAGKSTLVNVLTGRTPADGGTVEVLGAEVDTKGPAAALAAGVVAVPQELVMPRDMSVVEVVTLGAEPGRYGLLARRSAENRVRHLFGSLGLDLDVRSRVRDLPVSLQKVVLLAQALHRDARVLILDEPTAAMNAEDCHRVLDVVRRLRDRGLAILYISHRFDEVEALCDRVTAMADGRVIDVLDEGAVTHSRLVAAVTGDEASVARSERAPRPRLAHERASLRAVGLRGAQLDGVDLEVAPGEIVGVAGLPGSGVEEVFAQLSGQQGAQGGTIRVGDRALTSPASARRLGVGLLPASRAAASLPSEPVTENLVLPALARAGRAGLMRRSANRRFAAGVIDRLSLRPVADRRLGALSGGNQQRVLVGAKLLARPRFLLLEDPTVGVDVAARAELHSLLWSLADEGLGLVVGSSDAEELLGLCDRVVVLRRGRIVAAWPAGQATERALITSMTSGVAVPAS